jgi:hypothetical protein
MVDADPFNALAFVGIQPELGIGLGVRIVGQIVDERVFVIFRQLHVETVLADRLAQGLYPAANLRHRLRRPRKVK